MVEEGGGVSWFLRRGRGEKGEKGEIRGGMGERGGIGKERTEKERTDTQTRCMGWDGGGFIPHMYVRGCNSIFSQWLHSCYNERSSIASMQTASFGAHVFLL